MVQFNPGLTSITFRKKSPDEIISLCKKAKLSCIEWGSDIHCPPGDFENARKICEKTKHAGLSVSSYGTYYKVGREQNPLTVFRDYLSTSKLISAQTLRVWAFDKSDSKASTEEFELVVSETKALCSLAQEYGFDICFEYHRNTLTQTKDGALKLISAVGMPNALLYWQPNPDITREENKKELLSVLPYVKNIHVFHWKYDKEGICQRLPLSEGYAEWREYVNIIKEHGKGNYHILMEFVKDDKDDAFLDDADSLLNLLK